MVNSINQAIADKLNGLFNNLTIYDEKVPQNFKTPSFFISTYDQDYEKGISDRYRSTVSYDISYFPDSEYSLNNEMYEVRSILLRKIRDLGAYRAINIKSNITDDVLHIMFDVKYSETVAVSEIKMNKIETNTNIKEE